MIDLRKLNLPNGKNIEVGPELQRLGFIEGQFIKLNGDAKQFKIGARAIVTQLGELELTNDIIFKRTKDSWYNFKANMLNPFDLTISNFQLGEIIQSQELGIIDGDFKFAGSTNFKDVVIDSASADIRHLGLLKVRL